MKTHKNARKIGKLSLLEYFLYSNAIMVPFEINGKIIDRINALSEEDSKKIYEEACSMSPCNIFDYRNRKIIENITILLITDLELHYK